MGFMQEESGQFFQWINPVFLFDQWIFFLRVFGIFAVGICLGINPAPLTTQDGQARAKRFLAASWSMPGH
jgi:hypothetical protein